MAEAVQTKQTAEFKPYIAHTQNIPEFTLRAIIVGSVLALVFGVANAYLGLKVGMTVSASIPAAVMSMAILRGVLKNGTILENNIAQTIGSSGESLAAGVIFTIPAFLIWQTTVPGFNFTIANWQVILLSILGGFLGILFMIPLRRHLMSGFKLWPERFELTPRFFPGSQMGIEATPALMGVGFIIGPKIALLLFSGAVLGYLGIGPLIAFIGNFMTAPLPPATQPISELSASALRSNYIRYVGIGAVAMGGFISLLRFLPTIISSFKQVTAGLGETARVKIRTDEDLPTKLVWGGAFLIALAIWLMPKTEISLLGALLAVLFGFFFVTVSSRMVGIVGSSSLPISGMTIGTLIVVSVILLSSGVSGTVGMVAAMMVGSVVCIAVSMAGDASQDLKTGFLVGATPRRQQLAEFLGVLIPALVMGWVIMFLNKTYGFTGPTALEAPQANAMAAVVQGVMTGVLPWAFIVAGLVIGLSIELLGVHALPVAIGLYLPPELSTPIVIGSLIFWAVSRFSSSEARPARMEKGILFGSGMVAGDALVGVALSILVGTIASYAAYFTGTDRASAWLGAAFGNWFTLALFTLLGLGYLRYIWKKK